MRALARILLLLCLLPGLITGALPLPGQAAGLEMVICAEGGPQTIRITPDGTPVSHNECATCCLACGAATADLPPFGAHALRDPGFALLGWPRTNRDLPAPRKALFPAPRGPPRLV